MDIDGLYDEKSAYDGRNREGALRNGSQAFQSKGSSAVVQSFVRIGQMRFRRTLESSSVDRPWLLAQKHPILATILQITKKGSSIYLLILGVSIKGISIPFANTWN